MAPAYGKPAPIPASPAHKRAWSGVPPPRLPPAMRQRRAPGWAVPDALVPALPQCGGGWWLHWHAFIARVVRHAGGEIVVRGHRISGALARSSLQFGRPDRPARCACRWTSGNRRSHHAGTGGGERRCRAGGMRPACAQVKVTPGPPQSYGPGSRPRSHAPASPSMSRLTGRDLSERSIGSATYGPDQVVRLATAACR